MKVPEKTYASPCSLLCSGERNVKIRIRKLVAHRRFKGTALINHKQLIMRSVVDLSLVALPAPYEMCDG